ncbi:MAG: hypothetical protein HY901_02570 [Deltaproteobacteria bacterium]|nr:hypothetical protein [Deltaproteobacteria bacterium]
MKCAFLVMVVLAASLVGAARTRGGTPLVLEGLRAGGTGLGPLAAMLVVVLVLTGFTEVLLPREAIVRWLGESSGLRGGWRGSLSRISLAARRAFGFTRRCIESSSA